MEHLKRLVGIIAAVLLLAFVVPRVVPIQALPEELGFYPNKNEENPAIWAEQTLQYADPNSCGACHADKHSSWKNSKHASVSCENCHGPAEGHVKNMQPLRVDNSTGTCTVCHARITGRPESFPQIDIAQHAGDLKCVTCHNPHSPTITGAKS